MKQVTIRRSGFTLIEVLVVISIIGILASIIYANFGDARTEARNKALQSSLKETQLALELYKAQEGEYPADLGDLIPDFIAKLPVAADSANGICQITYDTEAAGAWYKLTAQECHAGADDATEGIQPDDEFARCPSSCADCGLDTLDAAYEASTAFYESYAVYSPGGECK